MKIAGAYLRVLIAWLLVMQPMAGGYAAAQAVRTPLALELCSGAFAPSDEAPSLPAADHAECCLVACAPAAAPPPAEAVHIPVPAVALDIGTQRPPSSPALAQAGLGPHSARAPPL